MAGSVVEELSDGNNRDDLCEPSFEGMKGQKRRRTSTRGGVSSRTRARKAVSNRNELVGEDAVQQQSAPVIETSVVSLSVDTESEDM
ncbi:hypothetical protein Bca52824_011368 [Brassica carinata]|uniref:Uncharacterized protein n=1 Tax=Brassica carinata TaxID=52824 RepID=A0A8X7WG57_BRACI|nr:hypothetical protein Bca52824_011368 [Brassica carinata]